MVLATCNEAVLFQDGSKLVLGRRQTVSVTFVFVLGLVTAICGVNAVVQIVMAFGENGSWPAAVALSLASALAGVALVAVVVARRRASGRGPVSELLLDGERGVLTDATGQVLAPLAQVRFERRFQIGSSSQALACRWPTGERVIARGNPFGESVDGIADALARAGLPTR